MCTCNNIFLLPYSKDSNMEHYLREKRSVKCDMIEKLSLNFKIELPGFDWSKNVGNDFIGASFGVKIVNFVELHMCKFINT